MLTITFTVLVGIRGPIPPSDYEARKKRIGVCESNGEARSATRSLLSRVGPPRERASAS